MARTPKRRSSSFGVCGDLLSDLGSSALRHGARYLHQGNWPSKAHYLLKEYYKENEAMLASYRERNAAQWALQDQREPVAKTGKKNIKRKVLKSKKMKASLPSSEVAATHVKATTSSASTSQVAAATTRPPELEEQQLLLEQQAVSVLGRWQKRKAKEASLDAAGFIGPTAFISAGSINEHAWDGPRNEARMG
ncbi:hypothetical protein MRX96_058346 [Rhipicephalus microplus]